MLKSDQRHFTTRESEFGRVACAGTMNCLRLRCPDWCPDVSPGVFDYKRETNLRTDVSRPRIQLINQSESD